MGLISELVPVQSLEPRTPGFDVLECAPPLLETAGGFGSQEAVEMLLPAMIAADRTCNGSLPVH